MMPMELAKRESEKSEHKFKIGAVIVRKNKILSRAFNMNKTNPRFGSGDYKMIHAEGHAIWKAVRQGIDIEGSVIYVYRERGNLACPCECCQKLIAQYGIRKVIYSAGKSLGYGTISL